jgi:hypothetical protein
VLLLPIAALAMMAFFLVLLMLGVAVACEERERRCLGSPAERMFCGMSRNPLDENARLVWATQLPVLEYLASYSASGVLPDSLRPRYKAMARLYPALYEGHRFEEWLEFLENSWVVCYRQEKLQLATHGHSVLDQCRSSCGHDSRRPR